VTLPLGPNVGPVKYLLFGDSHRLTVA
jgi:hypothetical protein